MDLKQFNELGYYIEKDVFSAEECERLIAESKTLENYKKGIFVPQMMPHRANDIYLEALRKPEIVSTVTKIVGGKPVGLQTEFFYCRPGTSGFGKHQDNFFVEAPANVFASAWCALTDVDTENGCLIAWPGTHKEGLLPVQKVAAASNTWQDPNARNEECIIPQQYKPVNIEVPKGAVCYIHSHLVHASNPNISKDRWRQVLLCTYIREGESFRAGQYAQREAIAV